MPKIMVVAGEVSGDMQAARVIRALKARRDDLTFFGMGGEKMHQEGVEILYDPTQISTIGFVEALKHLRKFYQILHQMEAAIIEKKPDLLFLVDYSAFNMKMSKIGQKHGITVVDYFSPSAWVWGKWRARRMAKYGAKIAAVFPMEADVYTEAGAEVTFVGHPLLDFVAPELTATAFYQLIELPEDTPIVGLLPGSRQGEIHSLLPPMLAAAKRILKIRPETHFLVPVASPRLKELILEVGESLVTDLPIHFVDGHAYEVMAYSQLIICASGTATLEAACLKTPMVIAYITSWSTYKLGKLMAKLDYAGLPNLIAGQEIVPEFLQGTVSGENLARAALELLEDDAKRDKVIANLEEVRQKLGASGAVDRVAMMIINELSFIRREGED